MRTQEEMVERVKMVMGEFPVIAITHDDIAIYLTAENLKQFAKKGVDLSGWTAVEMDKEKIEKEISSYLPFAWEKAEGKRGLSAMRSIAHFRNWLWLLGDDDLLAFVENDNNYTEYGIPMLLKIREKYGMKE